MSMSIDRSIFITNIFAQAFPEQHTKLWKSFEQEVPASRRTGHYGSDNVSYINWLKQKKDPLFMDFMQNHLDIRTF